MGDDSPARRPAAPRRPDPFALVIFGASGDLTHRKLMPAVYNLFAEGLLPEGFAVVGYGRSELTDDAFRGRVREGLARYSRRPPDDETWAAFAGRVHYESGQYDAAEDLQRLGRRVRDVGPDADDIPSTLYYLATPPQAFVPIARTLGAAGLARPPRRSRDGGPWTRLVVEKPFGHDLESALELDRALRGAFDESQVFRIDHYLGKETVQNLLVLRFANAIFEPIWNQKYVDHVQVTVAETVGMEGRGASYEASGAVRDIVQNHMMHLVSLVAMEPPLTLDAQAVRDEKVKVLRALRRPPDPCSDERFVLGQYAAGAVGGDAVPAYRQEKGVAEDSRTETFFAMKLFIDNWRWAGVPFYIRTGKRMPVKMTEISIHFREIPQVLFNADRGRPAEPNVLGVRIQPNEGTSLRFLVKVPGPAMEIRPFQMDFSYAEAFNREPPEAYERLLLDAALGDATLFTRGDEVHAAWDFLDPILGACDRRRGRPIPSYPAGTWGPEEADRLLESDGRRWMLFHRPKPRHG